MNILFLTLVKLNSLNDTMVYTDMLDTFSDLGHNVHTICPLEKRDNKENYVDKKKNIELLHANIGGNYFNVGSIEKGMTLVAFLGNKGKYYTRITYEKSGTD